MLQVFEIYSLRPNIERFIVYGEDAEDYLLQWPFRSVMTQDEFIVPQIPR